MNSEHDSPVPLSAVRAFEAAARLGSFTRAAAELGLTQSAISRHVRALEELFAVRLFHRQGRAVALTAVGATYFRPLNEAMRLIRTASGDMRRRGRRNSVTISLLPSVATLWLAPRLAAFTVRHPAIELNVHASRSLIDFSVDEADLSIRYGLGDWPGVRVEHLAAEEVTPVCSPEFAKRHGLGDDPRALLTLPLLADDLVDEWRDWFQAAGLADSPSFLGPRLNDSTSLYHAAMSGLGVALGRSLLVSGMLADNLLVAPFGLSVPASYRYWLVTPDRGERTPATRLFIAWLRAQMSETKTPRH